MIANLIKYTLKNEEQQYMQNLKEFKELKFELIPLNWHKLTTEQQDAVRLEIFLEIPMTYVILLQPVISMVVSLILLMLKFIHANIT